MGNQRWADRATILAAATAAAASLLLAGDVQGQAEPKRGSPQLWAVVVGVQQYEDFRQIPRCYGASEDAARFARWLIQTAGWEPGHVLLLSDRDLPALGFSDPNTRPDYRKATKTNLDWGAREWLARSVRPGDVAVVYYAGQAVGLPTRPDEPPGRSPRDYLLPVDARANDLENTGWSLGDAIDGIASRGEVSIVCLLDTSPAGKGQSPALLGKPARPAPAERMLRGISRWQGVTTWLAASDRAAGQGDDGQGHLTRALIRALGTRSDPRGLMECLDRLRREPTLARQGFQVAGGFDHRLTLWKPSIAARRRKEPPLIQRGHGDRVTDLAFTPDGGRLFTSSMDSTLRSWHVPSGTLLRSWSLLDNGCRALALSPDARVLAAGGGNGVFALIDLERDTPKLLTEKVHSGPVTHVAFLPTPDRAAGASYLLLSIDHHGLSAVWDASQPSVRRLSRPTDRGGRLPAVATRPGPVAFVLVAERFRKKLVFAFDAQGNLVREVTPPAGEVQATALSADGSRLWVGTETGELAEYVLPGGERRTVRNLGVPVTQLAATPLALAVVVGQTIRLEPWDHPDKPISLDTGRPIGRLACSVDGRRLAVADSVDGILNAWELDGDLTGTRPLTLAEEARPGREPSGRTLSLAFAPDGSRLVSGDGSGAIRSWNIPDGQARPTIAASRGRIRHLAISPDEKMLLQVSQDGIALVWDFAEQRGTRQVPGLFVPAGGFLPSGDLLLIQADGKHDLAVHDRASLVRRAVTFDRPVAPGGRMRSGRLFSRLSIAKNGRVAASSDEGALACYWTPQDGKYVLGPPIGEHRGGITAVGLAGDGQTLLTAADDGLAKLWDLSGAGPRLVTTFQANEPGSVRLPITAAAISPAADGPVALGRYGRLEIWERSGKQPPRVLSLGGQVWTVAFSADGKQVAAAGDGRTVTLRDLDSLSAPIQMNPVQSHAEQIWSLVYSPGGKVLASGSDDGTTRLWRLGEYRLLGTLSATGSGADWVAFTPEGLFDASTEGEWRVTWMADPNAGVGDPLPPRLEQYRKWHHVFDLAETLSRGESPHAPGAAGGPLPLPRSLPPEIVIEPITPPNPKQRRVDLKIRIDGEPLSDLRLYHNGVAVQGDLKLAGNAAHASLLLVNGPNQIYALGSRPDSLDGRSEPLNVAYDGPTAGRTHVLALGVSEYQTQRLRFAHKDAQAMAEFLHANGISQPGTPAEPPILLQNSQVSREAVSEALKELRKRVRGRPEDTLVVFVAGHSEVKQGLFCMLLHDALLPAGEPVVAQRGVESSGSGIPPGEDPTLLPYGLVHLNLQACDALNRLVIVDACQAESVFDDPIVRRRVRQSIRKAADRDAHASRTSYILATRRGEREQAVESARLEHGLLTYTLLRGMGKKDLRELIPLPDIFLHYPTADIDRDGFVTTNELRQYSEMAVPVLIDRFPELVQRGAPPAKVATPEKPSHDECGQESDASASFPLVKTPGP